MEVIASSLQSSPSLEFGSLALTRVGSQNGKVSYRPLDTASYETRFLQLDVAGVWDGSRLVISCRLVYHKLIAPFRYTALSYRWGDAKESRHIAVDGAIVPVTASLESALRELGNAGETVIWADALCINQDDTFERNYQVTRMAQIYSLATKVVAWLGDLDTAFTTKAASRSDRSLGVEDFPLLLRNPYWTRVWIVQELARAKEVEIWFGTYVISWQELEYALEWSQVNEPTLLSDYEVFGNLRDLRQREKQSSIGVARPLLSEVLLRTYPHQATDPRDKLYAVLGLALDGDKVVSTPNYWQPVEDVCRAATKFMVVNQGQTSLLLLAGERLRATAVASWIALWSESLGPSLPPWIVESVRLQRETLDITNRCGKNDVLHVDGVALDEISPCPEAMPQPAVHVLTHKYESVPIIMALFDLLTLGWKHSSEYVEQKSASFTLTALCLANCPNVRLRSLEKWYDNHEHWNFHGRTVREWITGHYHLARAQSLEKQCDLAIKSVHYHALRAGLALMRKHGMKTIATTDHGFRIVFKAARGGDIICRLRNCALPIVLRPARPLSFLECSELWLEASTFNLPSFYVIGETFMPNPGRQDSWKSSHYWKASTFASQNWARLKLC